MQKVYPFLNNDEMQCKCENLHFQKCAKFLHIPDINYVTH